MQNHPKHVFLLRMSNEHSAFNQVFLLIKKQTIIYVEISTSPEANQINSPPIMRDAHKHKPHTHKHTHTTTVATRVVVSFVDKPVCYRINPIYSSIYVSLLGPQT